MIIVLYGQFRGVEVNGEIQHLSVGGTSYKVGQQTAIGTVLSADLRQVHIMDEAGNSTFIYPGHNTEERESDLRSRKQTQQT